MFCPCSSVHPSARCALNKVCEVNPSQSFQAINLKLCTDVASILKMCMWHFEDEPKLTKYVIFGLDNV